MNKITIPQTATNCQCSLAKTMKLNRPIRKTFSHGSCYAIRCRSDHDSEFRVLCASNPVGAGLTTRRAPQPIATYEGWVVPRPSGIVCSLHRPPPPDRRRARDLLARTPTQGNKARIWGTPGLSRGHPRTPDGLRARVITPQNSAPHLPAIKEGAPEEPTRGPNSQPPEDRAPQAVRLTTDRREDGNIGIYAPTCPCSVSVPWVSGASVDSVGCAKQPLLVLLDSPSNNVGARHPSHPLHRLNLRGFYRGRPVGWPRLTRSRRHTGWVRRKLPKGSRLGRRSGGPGVVVGARGGGGPRRVRHDGSAPTRFGWGLQRG